MAVVPAISDSVPPASSTGSVLALLPTTGLRRVGVGATASLSPPDVINPHRVTHLPEAFIRQRAERLPRPPRQPRIGNAAGCLSPGSSSGEARREADSFNAHELTSARHERTLSMRTHKGGEPCPESRSTITSG